MKRALLWITNLLFLMFLSAAAALPSATPLRALDAAEVASVTAGTCSTCKPEYPYIEYEGWDLISQRESKHTYLNRMGGREIVNPADKTVGYELEYFDDCRKVWTGGSATIGKSLGISFNSTYHCNERQVLRFTLGPRESVRLYDGYKRYYITYTYRHFMQWSDGYRELSGLTETIREEFTYYYREIE